MTCIIGLESKGMVYIGGDSAGVSGLSVTVRADEKVFVTGDFIMGYTTSFRMGQLLRYKFEPPVHPNDMDDMKFLVTHFVDSVRKCFQDNGYGSKDNGGTFLVGYRGKLYCIQSDFQVAKPSLPYDAVGCGADLAMGAMFANDKLKPKDRIEKSLLAASTFNAGVVAPFLVLKK